MLFSLTEKFSLWSSSLILNILGIKIKCTKESFLYNIFYPFRHSADFGINNKIYSIDKSGNQKEVSLRKFKNIKIYFYGNNNTLIIHEPCKLIKSDIVFVDSNSKVEIGENCAGKLQIYNHHDNCNFKIGKDAYICFLQTALYGCSIEIGDNCLFSNNVKILSDPHSVIDKSSGEVLNKAKNPIKIGNHVWVGERVTMTKNAQIPDDCVVGIASVVTKSFDEPSCVIAGAPAKVAKRNITWNWEAPL